MARRMMIIKKDSIQHVYSDKLKGLSNRKGVQATTKRASHVEPTSDNQWTADMSPVGGPMLGPFETRQLALDAENEWLLQNALGDDDEESTN